MGTQNSNLVKLIREVGQDHTSLPTYSIHAHYLSFWSNLILLQPMSGIKVHTFILPSRNTLLKKPAVPHRIHFLSCYCPWVTFECPRNNIFLQHLENL